MLKRLLLWTRPLRYYIDGLTYKRSDESGRLAALRNRYEGRPMLIVGNGPSLNSTPLDDFSHIPAIGMNKIDLLYPRVEWRPSLVICTNNLVIQQHAESLASSTVPVYLSWKGRRFIARPLRKHFDFFLSLASPEFSTELPMGVGSAGTVTYTALQFAYYLGANPVILFGVDHSFATTGKPNEIEKRRGADINHFDANYFKAGVHWGVPNLPLSETGYELAKSAFAASNRTIYDATVDGKLRIFPRISLDRARALCGLQ